MSHHKFKMVSLALFFTLFITFPLINNTFCLIQDAKNTENRALAKKPILDINCLDPFPEKYESYYNDNFSLRTTLVNYFTYYNLRLYKKSPFPDRVVIGYNDWLYLAGNELNCYLGTNRLTNEQLKAFMRDLEFQKNFLEERGCKFYFVVTPTKANVHSENIPYTYFRFNKESLGEQLTNYLKKNSDINVISLFDPLRNIKENHQLYYKQDNHWNRKGAFYAANIVATKIKADFANVQPLSLSDFIVKQIPKKEGDIKKILGDQDFYDDDIDYEFISKKTKMPINFDHMDYASNASPQLQTRNSKKVKKIKLLLISDSFSYSFFPFISESFSESVNVFDQWQYKLFDYLVDQEKPDVYVLMIYEPFLMFVPDNRSRLKK